MGKAYSDPAFAREHGISQSVAHEFLKADKAAGKHFSVPKRKRKKSDDAENISRRHFRR